MAHFVKRTPSSTSGSSKPQSESTSGRGINATSKQVAGHLQQVDLNRIKRQVSGNAQEAMVNVTFPYANRDYFVGHKLGFTVKDFDAESPSAPAKFYMGVQPPNRYGMWIRCDTAGVTARIRMHGQKGVQ